MKKVYIIALLLLVLGIGLFAYLAFRLTTGHGLLALSEDEIDLMIGFAILLIFTGILLLLAAILISRFLAKRVTAAAANASNTFTAAVSKSAVKTDQRGSIVIKRPLWGNLLFVFLCLTFVAGGVFIMQLDQDMLTVIIGIIAIVFFGGGGLLYVILMMRKPIVMINDQGVTVPHGWGEHFAKWENITKIEVLEQSVAAPAVGTGSMVTAKQKYIGIFVFDRREIAGTGERSQAITKRLTGWETAPALLINLSFSFLNIQYVTHVLQELHDKYRDRSA